MTQHFLNKERWTRDQWNIYFNNLDILRLQQNLSKKQLNAVVGRWNLYRKDAGRPHEATILKICTMFNVSPSWLATPRPKAKKSKRHEPTKKIAYSIKDFCPGYMNDTKMDSFGEAVVRLREIFDSGDEALIAAVEANIAIFSRTVSINKEYKDLKSEVDLLKNRLEVVEQMAKESPPKGFQERRKSYRDLKETLHCDSP